MASLLTSGMVALCRRLRHSQPGPDAGSPRQRPGPSPAGDSAAVLTHHSETNPRPPGLLRLPVTRNRSDFDRFATVICTVIAVKVTVRAASLAKFQRHAADLFAHAGEARREAP